MELLSLRPCKSGGESPGRAGGGTALGRARRRTERGCLQREEGPAEESGFRKRNPPQRPRAAAWRSECAGRTGPARSSTLAVPSPVAVSAFVSPPGCSGKGTFSAAPNRRAVFFWRLCSGKPREISVSQEESQRSHRSAPLGPREQKRRRGGPGGHGGRGHGLSVMLLPYALLQDNPPNRKFLWPPSPRGLCNPHEP